MSVFNIIRKFFIFALLVAFSCQLNADQLSVADKNERVKDLIKDWTNAGIFKWSGKKNDSLILVEQIKGANESELISSSKTIHRMLAMAETSKPVQLIIATKARAVTGKTEIRIGASMYGINSDAKTVFLSEEHPNMPLIDLTKLLAAEKPK